MVYHVVESDVQAAIRAFDCRRLNRIPGRHCHHREIQSSFLPSAVRAMLYIEPRSIYLVFDGFAGLRSF